MLCAAGLSVISVAAWLNRERLHEAWDFHIVESGGPEESARILERRMELDPRRAAPYVVFEILDPGKDAWLQAVAEAMSTPPKFIPSSIKPAMMRLPIDAVHSLPFRGLDNQAPRFLSKPDLQPAASTESPGAFTREGEYEFALISGLANSSAAIRVQALALLVRVHSPSSVATQWSTLQALKQERVSRAWERAISTIESSFDGPALLRELEEEPRPWRQDHRDYLLEWSLRAAGVTGLRAALPRLRELSASGNLDVAIAAERSLEDFTGPEVDAALLHCLLAWRYKAFIRAGWALLARAPARLLEALEPALPPEDAREWRTLFLMQARMRLQESGPK